MRVVNDRRRLPRVAWNGQAVIQTRRGEVRGVGLDLSADGMAVLVASPAKAKERVRIHMQLGEFPLLTDARVVRMKKRRDGYRWSLRFDRMDERMRANLEMYVRQQLANVARVRQAQLYAQRLKGGSLPMPPSATPPPSSFTPVPAGVPTPAPIDPRVRAGITLPPIEPQGLGIPSRPAPTELSLDGLAEVLPNRPLEIELPPMGPGPDQPVLDIADEPPRKQDVFVPYQSSSATDEATLLGEGVMTPDPSKNRAAVPATPPPAPKANSTPAEVLAPGVIDISDDEDLSLEDILAEVEAGGTLVPGMGSQTPVSDLQMPPKQDAAKVPTQGLGDVPVLDDEMGDEEETLARDAPPVAATIVKTEGAAALMGAPLEDAPALDRGLSDEAPALAGAPMTTAPALMGAPLDDAPALDSGLFDDAAALGGTPPTTSPSGAPLEDSPALDSGLFDDAAALVGAPPTTSPSGAPLEDSPALDGGMLDDAAALVGTPPTTGPSGAPLEETPALDGGLLDDAAALVGAPMDNGRALEGAPFGDVPPSARSTLLPGAPDPASESPPHEFGGAPFLSEPLSGDDSDKISLSEFAPAMERSAAQATEVGTSPEPANPYDTPLPSSSQPYISVGPNREVEEDAPVRREEDAPRPSHVPTPGPTDVGPEVGSADADEEDEFPEPPALLDPVAAADSSAPGTPSSTIYSTDAAPFDPYAPNPAPTAGATPSRLGSAPRALGELPPVVEGLYTPTSNPKIEEPSAAYRTASFQPFLSAEEGLYGGREDVTFEEQQGNPRQRLALLQEDDKSTHKLAQQHDLFLGDIEGVTSGAASVEESRPAETESKPPTPPTDAEELDFAEVEPLDDEDAASESPSAESEEFAVVRAEAEKLQAAVPDHELGDQAPTSMHGLPELVEMAPTRPIDVDGSEGFTPAPHDLTPPPHDLAAQDHTPAPQDLELDDVEVLDDGGASSVSNHRAAPTFPDFNVIPDYDQPLDSDSAPSGPAPAQSGHTIVASFEELGLPAPSPGDSAELAEPSAPSDFAVLPSFEGAQIGAGFTMVASFDAEADVGASSTMIATAGDIDAWRSAGVASAEPPGAAAVIPPEFDEEPTGMYTPAPGSLPPLGPAAESPAPLVGGPALNDEALTSMRVGPGGQPTGAGFELNPRGPAPESQPPVVAAPAATVSAPGPSSRGQTNLDTAGRPGPPPKPMVTAPVPTPDPSDEPALRGSGSVAPAAPRRSLVEDALADLKRKTDSRRKKRETLSPIEEKAKAIAEDKRAAKQERRRKRLGKAEMVDPAIADLYKAAMTDLTRTSE